MVTSEEIVLLRDGPPAVVPVVADEASELLLALTVSAPGIDWARRGAESAVVQVRVDGRHATDVLAFGEADAARSVGLGRVGAGRHAITLMLAGGPSAPAARVVRITGATARTVPLGSDLGVVLRHAPVIYGRTRRRLGSRFQNAVTDTPLLGWHSRRPATRPGHERLEYTVLWSGEDGGTDASASMARWGRTTDIEWVYNLEVDAAGRRVGRAATRFHGPRHVQLPFFGRFEHDHPLLKTWTANNNLVPALGGAMRFMLDFAGTSPAGRAREALMDANPWTYAVMAGELVREGRLEAVPDPRTAAVGDPRTYLYVEIAKRTRPTNTGQGAVGVAVGVRLRDDPTVYRSDHGIADRAIERDGPAATAVELPAGTRAEDVAEITAWRVPMAHSDGGGVVTVTQLHRAFLLDAAYLPQPSLARWEGTAVLTREAPTATVWSRAG